MNKGTYKVVIHLGKLNLCGYFVFTQYMVYIIKPSKMVKEHGIQGLLEIISLIFCSCVLPM